MAAQMDASQLSMDFLFSVDGTATPLDDLLLELATSPVGTDGSLLSLTEALVSPGALVGTSGAADVCGGYDNQVPCCDVQPPLAPEARPNSPVCKPCAVSCVPPVRSTSPNPRPVKRARGTAGAKRSSGSNSKYEKRRRARVSDALQALRTIVFPTGHAPSPHDAAELPAPTPGAGRKGRRSRKSKKPKPPTETEVLAAAIGAIKRAVAARGSVVDALAPVPECASHLPLTDLERSARMGCFISGELVRTFQRPDRRELVAMAFEAAEVTCPMPRSIEDAAAGGGAGGSGGPCWTRRTGLVARLFRMCTPVVLHVLAQAGLSADSRVDAAQYTDATRMLWSLPECRRAFGEVRCLWFAPHLSGTPVDKLPVEELVTQLRMVVDGVAGVLKKHISLDDSAPFSSTQALIDPLVAWILPLWEDAASNLGLPRTLDGIARLHRAVAVMTDTRVIELSWAAMASCVDASRFSQAGTIAM